jgi:hypothetical protein
MNSPVFTSSDYGTRGDDYGVGKRADSLSEGLTLAASPPRGFDSCAWMMKIGAAWYAPCFGQA